MVFFVCVCLLFFSAIFSSRGGGGEGRGRIEKKNLYLKDDKKRGINNY